MASQEVHFTGERVIPGEVNQDLWNEHYSRYQFAATFSAGKRVLDVGCGAGYGTALLAKSAAEAIGFDVSLEAVEYAKQHYGRKAIFMAGDALCFPADDKSFHIVTAFEVIEHVAEYERLIAEAARVLVDGGILLVSTPNKLYYSETRKEAGPNPFHVHEFELEEFCSVLRHSFPHVQVMAQNQQEAVVFGGASDECGTSYIASGPPLQTAQFFIALCSNRPVTANSYAYVAEAGNVLREREHYIRLLQDELGRAQADHLHLLEEHERSGGELKTSNSWALSLDRELVAARNQLDEFERESEEKTKWAQDLDRQLREKSSELENIVTELDDTHRELVKRTAWAQQQETLSAERTRWAQEQDRVVQLQAERLQELQATLEERTAWALRLDQELTKARGLVEERTAWASRLDAELRDHSSARHVLRTELSAVTERAANLAGSEATLEQLSKQLKEENRQLKEQLRRGAQSVDEQLAAIQDRAERLVRERELVRKSKWLKIGKLLHLGPRLTKDNPPV